MPSHGTKKCLLAGAWPVRHYQLHRDADGRVYRMTWSSENDMPKGNTFHHSCGCVIHVINGREEHEKTCDEHRLKQWIGQGR